MNPKTREREDTQDHISRLPEFLIGRILFGLSGKEAARTCVLSKLWNHSYSTSDSLEFNLSFDKYLARVSHNQYLTFPNHEQVFLNSMNNCIARCLIQREYKLHDFALFIKFPSLDLLAPSLESWVNAAIERNVQNIFLHLKVGTDALIQRYCVPCKLLSLESLTSLVLFRCTLEGIHSVKLAQLRNLNLRDCMLDDQSFHEFILDCPSIENLYLGYCHGLSSLRLFPSLIQLEQVLVIAQSKFSIEHKAPNVHFTLLWRDGMEPILKILSVEGVKRLKLIGGGIRNEQLKNVMSEVLDLELFHLLYDDNLRMFQTSSQKVKQLLLISFDIDVVQSIDTPNLRGLYYECPRLPFKLKLNPSTLRTVHFGFHVYENDRLMELLDLLKKASLSKDLKLAIHDPSKCITMVHEKFNNIQLPLLQNLANQMPNMCFCIASEDLPFVVQTMHPLYKPRILSVVCSNDNPREFLFKYFVEKDGGDAGGLYFKYVTDNGRRFAISDSKELEENECNGAWANFLKTHSDDQYRTSTFRLTWASSPSKLMQTSTGTG